MNYKFVSKAQTLRDLSLKITHSNILPVVFFSRSQWNESARTCLQLLRQNLGQQGKVIIRSSSHAEDQETHSNAGRFDSYGKVNIADDHAVAEKINYVFQSYSTQDTHQNDQVLIQPMLENVDVSGVLFTRDISTFSPYYVINYDDQSQRTDSVTLGDTNELKTFVSFKIHQTQNSKFMPLLKAAQEIETIVGIDYLDIEFAIKDQIVYIFQVRPLVRRGNRLPDSSEILHYLKKIDRKLEKIIAPHPYLKGHKSILGTMSDWNPAEMIGFKPRPLAISLYKELITDRIWASQRYKYGYRDVRSVPLIINLLGIPYVDIRASLNSFIPAELDDRLAEKLSDYYLKKLGDFPGLHDKIEFEIVFSCAYFGMHDKVNQLLNAGFTRGEVSTLCKSLINLTKGIISNEGFFREDLKQIEELKKRQQHIIGSQLFSLDKIYWLIEDCKQYGTLPFAGVARAGFVAMQLLNSLRDNGIISRDEYTDFMSSIRSVSKELTHDLSYLPHDRFLERYGHLRPGTYDILSKRYDEAFNEYFKENKEESELLIKSTYSSDILTTKFPAINNEITKLGIDISAQDLLAFIKDAIEGREYVKLIFTKSISTVLFIVENLFGDYGLSAEEASFIDIQTLLKLYSNLDHLDLYTILSETSYRNKKHFDITKYIKLPDVITDKSQSFEFEITSAVPNYITFQSVKAEVVQERSLKSQDISKKIVCIESADPGHDWIFSKGIGGLITKYGGANSHMAIRAAEMKIPAVIGCGELNYTSWSEAKVLKIDCEKRLVIQIQ